MNRIEMIKFPPVRSSMHPAPTAILVTALGLLIALAMPASYANAYAIGSGSGPSSSGATAPRTTSTIGTPYNFGASFENLIAPFMNFIRNIQMSNGTVSVGIPVSGMAAGGGTASGVSASPVSVNVNLTSYIDQFDVWVYNTTGVHINGAMAFIGKFLTWAFSTADNTAQWIAKAVSRSIPHSNGAVGPQALP